MCITACRKRFTYRNPESDQHGRWSMHEFSCSLSKDIVICLLRKKGSAAQNRPTRVEKTSSRKRKAVVDQVASAMPTQSKKPKIDQEPCANENQQMGLEYINDNKSAAPVATNEDDLDCYLNFDGCFTGDVCGNEAVSVAVPHEDPQKFNNSNYYGAARLEDEAFSQVSTQLPCPQPE